MAQTTPVWRRLGSSRRRRRPTPTPHCCRCPVVYSVDYNLIELNVSSSPGCPAVSWSWNIFAISFRKLSNKTFIRIKKHKEKEEKTHLWPKQHASGVVWARPRHPHRPRALALVSLIPIPNCCRLCRTFCCCSRCSLLLLLMSQA
jgi:hypothetical protein